MFKISITGAIFYDIPSENLEKNNLRASVGIFVNPGEENKISEFLR
jgi:hypothetical protein